MMLFSNPNNGEPNVDLYSFNNGDTNDAHGSHRLSEEINSTCSTPYVSAPSSCPTVGYFFSASASPMHYYKEAETPSIETTLSGSTSSSRSSSSGRNSKKWIFFKNLLYKSKNEGRGNKKKFWSSMTFTCSSSSRDGKEKNRKETETKMQNGDRDIVAHKTLPLRVSETSSSKQSDDEGLISPHESHFQFNFPNSKTKSQPFLPYHASTSKQGENHPTMSKSSSKNKTLSDDHNISSAEFFEVNLVMRMLLQLSWEMVKEITGGFTRMTCFEENENFKTYCRYLNDHQSQVLVRRFIGQLDCVLKAEKKAALSMHHKNILGLSGYYKGKNGTVLIYPFTRRWTLDIFLHVKFVDDLIIGFSIATWLHLKQGLPISSNRFWHTDPSDLESLALLKSDIIHFGILLLRLFCRRSAPRDDKIFVDWARLLLLQRAFHKLLDEDMENLDVYGIFRVMCVAAQCINSKPIS
ncbi:hypothetical protein TEA_008336 [Camellia sinensis var. sinensis]|uniref:Serine-threonine/tyrosine-protein kinase catalytic domain-containing protein n=1 Tax=Camellia sinensis var. sinensis TaxID=542762 RepID=A0A4S4DDS7_CAMSN|nr:hypothetical protein TEA_008336 [Camellia sinensis var. sinensis]